MEQEPRQRAALGGRRAFRVVGEDDAAASSRDLDAGLRALLPGRDPAALRAFYDAWFERVYGYVRRMVRDDHLAEDLTQEVFLRLHQALPGYDPARPLGPWVFTIAANKVRDHWRSRARRVAEREVPVESEERGPLADEGAPRPDAALVSDETSRAVALAVEALPESMRSALVLRYYEGLSFAEIGAVLGRSEVAVRKRYSRALEALRDSLADELGPAGGSW
ncbi:MAG: RNA polymerase sigma factor [Planctomycetes bacterium]|nr:RNA polymerase sigma factor [Planctomycetota bacterium]